MGATTSLLYGRDLVHLGDLYVGLEYFLCEKAVLIECRVSFTTCLIEN